MIGVSLGPGSFPAIAESSWPLKIAAAGLEHWKAGSGKHAREFLQASLALCNEQIKERDFMASQPAGVTDRKWLEVLHRTCTSAGYSERNAWSGADDVFPYRQVFAFGCRRKHGYLDQFTALAEDAIWETLRPPFDWACICSVVPLLPSDVRRKKTAQMPGVERIGEARLVRIATWLERSPAAALDIV